jgi:large subunit ribosomal protein L19
MSLFAKHNETEFGVGDKIKVHQRIKEGEKERLSVFDGMVISIKGRGTGVSFTVRRIGEAGVGIEKIFPLSLPTIEKIEVLKKGTAGVRHAKLFFTREKSPREIDAIYARANRKGKVPQPKKKATKKHAAKKK